MPRIKRIKPKGFTTVNNDFLRDKSLSLAARGLLVTLLSLPDGWNMSGRGLASILADSEYKVFTTLNLLEEAGYLNRVSIREKGKFVDTEYQFCDSPIFPKKETKKTIPKDSNQPKTPRKKNAEPEVLFASDTHINENCTYSCISPRTGNIDDIVANMDSLHGEALKRYVFDCVLEKVKCVADFSVPEDYFNLIASTFIRTYEKYRKLHHKMAYFSAIDVADVYSKVNGRENPVKMIETYFINHDPFWKE